MLLFDHTHSACLTLHGNVGNAPTNNLVGIFIPPGEKPRITALALKDHSTETEHVRTCFAIPYIQDCQCVQQ